MKLTLELKVFKDIVPRPEDEVLLWSPTKGYLGMGYFSGRQRDTDNGRRFYSDQSYPIPTPDDVMWCCLEYDIQPDGDLDL